MHESCVIPHETGGSAQPGVWRALSRSRAQRPRPPALSAVDILSLWRRRAATADGDRRRRLA
eukprot:249668-Prymnesium_polylepis.1